MPYKYILKWQQGEKERVTVEAWNRYPVSKKEKEKALFLIGTYRREPCNNPPRSYRKNNFPL